MSFDLEALRDAINTHGTVGRLLIAEHAGSAPRETGTAMLVWKDGQAGTIGGGALEFQAVDRLRARLAIREASLERLPLGPALGQCCGGAVTLVSEVFDAESLDQTDAAQGWFIRRVAGERPEPLSMTRLRAQHRNGQNPTTLVFEDGWLAEPLQTPRRPLWIYGAGHVGQAIVNVLSPTDQFDITWVDTSQDRFPAEISPEITMLPASNPADAVQFAPPDAEHLILTYSHTLDLELCHRLLKHGFASAGLIGSATKWARFKSRLAALGHRPELIGKITCPIGDPALGKHPQAIALGVARALLLSSRAHKGRSANGGRATA